MDTNALIRLAAVPEWSDFDDRHGRDCIFLQSTLPVRLNMTQPSNGQALSQQEHRLLPKGSPLCYTGETLLRTRQRTYRKVVTLLADPDWSVKRISEACRVSEHTVNAVRNREQSTIEQRKKTLTSVLVDVATLGAEQMERKIGKASLRDASIATGVSVDKVLALQGKSPVSVQIANVWMPGEEERELLNECHRRLRAVSIGESKDLKTDIAWLAAYSKTKESKGPQLPTE
jgi:hypothetical protein